MAPRPVRKFWNGEDHFEDELVHHEEEFADESDGDVWINMVQEERKQSRNKGFGAPFAPLGTQ